MSPFIYRMRDDGSKQWSPGCKEGGHYYDALYGNKVVRLRGQIKMDPNW
jgi:hypothetical protein